MITVWQYALGQTISSAIIVLTPFKLYKPHSLQDNTQASQCGTISFLRLVLNFSSHISHHFLGFGLLQIFYWLHF